MTEDNDQLNEPGAIYEREPSQKKITFFNSFEEATEHKLKQMAGHSYAERLNNLEIIRRSNYVDRPPLGKMITIITGTFK